MRRLTGLAVASLLVRSIASPGLAGVAAITTPPPLLDCPEESITVGFLGAVAVALTGAVAMGLGWFQAREALVLDDMVTIQVLATGVKPDVRDEAEPGENAGIGGESGPRRGLAL